MACFIVTGGTGFVGKALATALKERGDEVWSLSRSDAPQLRELGINTLQADLSAGLDSCVEVFERADAVFHVAAKVDMWGKYEDFFASNVVGTRNVIEACKKGGVKRLVYTSSPSVVADGTDLCGVNEDYPYPAQHDAFYPATKAMAEREVLAENGKDGLLTCALRPHLIFGPGDTNLIPTVLERAKAGRLARIGDGSNLVDICFIRDCVRAHLLAEQALRENKDAAGRAYFISQAEPVKLWAWIDDVVTRSGLEPISKKYPKSVALALARVFEFFAKVLPGQREPLFTHFLVSEMATSHYFDLSNAKKFLGFEPQYSVAEAMEITFQNQSQEEKAVSSAA